MNRSDVYALIDRERRHQHSKWAAPHRWGVGDCSSGQVTDLCKTAVLAEEVGEVSRAVLDGTDNQLRAELVQVAAVAVAWLEAMP